jgi:phosphatidate cytidylyltransferase
VRSRVLTGAALAVIVVLTVLFLGTLIASIVFALVWMLGAAEWAGLVRLGRGGRLAYAGVFAALCAAVLMIALPSELVLGWLIAAELLWACAFVAVLSYPVQTRTTPVLVAGIVVLSAAWLAVHVLHGLGPEGPGLVLTGLLIVWSADVGAFFVGRTVGRTPLAPRVSPKKTWEGVVGGLVLACITGSIAAAVLSLPFAVLVPLSAGVALVSVVGDLGISLLKRRAGLKDSGVLLPGHGGILDRFDGVTAALPFFVLGLQFANVLD